MGTRSNTVVIETGYQGKAETILVNMYKQYDGYLEGHGKNLFDFLNGLRICNGISTQQQAGRWANGMSCFAAQMVAHFKKDNELGGIYLHDPSDKSWDNDYAYIIRGNTFVDGGDLTVEVRSWRETIFKGTVAEFEKFLANPPRDEE